MKDHKTAETTTRTALIVVFLLLPLLYTYGQPSHIPRPPPGIPAVNLTDTIPVNHMDLVERGNPKVLRFQNLDLEVNSTKNISLVTTTHRSLPHQYLKLDLAPGESLELGINVTIETPAQASPANDGIGVYLYIEPNSTEQVTSNLSLYINNEAIEKEIGHIVNPMALSWAYWNGTDWETVESWLDEGGYLVTHTDHLSLWTIRETGKPIRAPEIPGLPEEAKAHNYAGLTPRGFTWRVKEKEPAVLLFQDMTMIFNSTRELPVNLSVNQMIQDKILRLDISPGASLSLDIMVDVKPPSGVLELEKDIGVYVEIEPNATVSVDANLSLYIEEQALEDELNREVDLSWLSWAYWEDDHWVYVESIMDENGYLNAKTSHFSVWTIAEKPEPTITVPGLLPDIPGIPEDIPAYNYSDTRPVDFILSLEAGEPAVFSFEGIVLMVNPGEMVEIEFTVGEGVAEQVFSLYLVPGESVEVNLDVQVDPPTGVEIPEGYTGLYFELEPNMTVSLDATLSLLIDEEKIEAEVNRDINVSRLTWAFWEGESWTPVESVMDENGYLSAETDHFSTWTVLEEKAIEPPQETAPEWPSYTWLIILGVIAVVVVIVSLRGR